MTENSETELKGCPHCGSESCRVIGGPGTRGGPQFWAGCDHCNGRAWGNTQAEAISAWNRRPPPLMLWKRRRRWRWML